MDRTTKNVYIYISLQVLHNLKEKETVPNTDVTGSGRNEGHGNGKTIASEKYGKNNINKLVEYHVDLREAPMGPDPLHHHGGIPKNKPVKMP